MPSLSSLSTARDRVLTRLACKPGPARRRAAWQPAPSPYERGFTRLYREHVTQAHEGCDFDFLQGTAPTPEPPIY